MRRDLTAGSRGAEQPMNHSEGWQQRGKARELGQSQSCRNPLTQSLPEPQRPRESCRQRSAGGPAAAAVPCQAGKGGVSRATHCVVPPAPWGAAFMALFFIRMSTPV